LIENKMNDFVKLLCKLSEHEIACLKQCFNAEAAHKGYEDMSEMMQEAIELVALDHIQDIEDALDSFMSPDSIPELYCSDQFVVKPCVRCNDLGETGFYVLFGRWDANKHLSEGKLTSCYAQVQHEKGNRIYKLIRNESSSCFGSPDCFYFVAKLLRIEDGV
jgi:hypothetical protein